MSTETIYASLDSSGRLHASLRGGDAEPMKPGQVYPQYRPAALALCGARATDQGRSYNAALVHSDRVLCEACLEIASEAD